MELTNFDKIQQEVMGIQRNIISDKKSLSMEIKGTYD